MIIECVTYAACFWQKREFFLKAFKNSLGRTHLHTRTNTYARTCACTLVRTHIVICWISLSATVMAVWRVALLQSKHGGKRWHAFSVLTAGFCLWSIASCQNRPTRRTLSIIWQSQENYGNSKRDGHFLSYLSNPLFFFFSLSSW